MSQNRPDRYNVFAEEGLARNVLCFNQRNGLRLLAKAPVPAEGLDMKRRLKQIVG